MKYFTRWLEKQHAAIINSTNKIEEMKQFTAFVGKEFLHIFRDPRTMLILLAMPIIQLLIFGFAISQEIRDTPLAIVDYAGTDVSNNLIEKFANNKYFVLKDKFYSVNEVEQAFRKGSVKVALIIPQYFGNDLFTRGADIQLLADASDPNEASTVTSYMQQIINDYQMELFPAAKNMSLIKTEVKMLYNPQMKSTYFFVPGLMGLLLMLICAMMTSISIVREKEQGTMEVLLVSPVKPLFVVLSKAVPYLIIAMLDVILILLVSVFVLQVPISGSILLILFLSFVFTLSTLSLGLLISSITTTQQAAMMISSVALMVPTILLSGLIFSIENMPILLQIISRILPATWFIKAVKDVMIKGLGFWSIWREFLILSGTTVFLLFVSTMRFKNRL